MTETIPFDPAATGVDPADLAVLRAAVTGPVLAGDDVEVVTELAGFNLAPEHAPVAVVGATDAQDVAAAVRWAGARGLPVGVLATGHGSWSHRGGVVITMRRLDGVRVDPEARTATVGGGVKWARVVEAAAPHGLAALNGSSTDVGVVGYTLGGGVSTFVRRHGLACDLVRRMRVVTGDGVVREVDHDSEEELFSTLLGGMDSAGIVTEMEFGLVEAPEIHGGGLLFDAADIAAVLHAWREWAPTLPRETTTSVAILRVPDLEFAPPPLRGRTVAHLRVAHLGSAASGDALLAPMRAVATPILDTVAELPYTAIDAVHLDPTDPMPSWDTGAFLADVDAGTIDTILAVAGPEQEVPLVLVELRHIDGALHDPGTARGCVPRAGARFVVGVVAPMVPELREAVPAIGLGLMEALTPWRTGAVPLTWGSAQSLAGRGAGWDDRERGRLASVVERHDPAGVLGGARYGLR